VPGEGGPACYLDLNMRAGGVAGIALLCGCGSSGAAGAVAAGTDAAAASDGQGTTDVMADAPTDAAAVPDGPGQGDAASGAPCSVQHALTLSTPACECRTSMPRA
jgi:hypothetical protein